MISHDPEWQPPLAIVAQLATRSPKARLQTILRHLCYPESDRAQSLPAVPLSDLQITAAGAYQYTTAIAHPLAAAQGRAVDTLAQTLAQQLTTPRHHQPDTLVTGLTAQALPTGWITLTLSAVGVAEWWQHRAQGEWPKATSTPPQSADCWPPATPWPLSDRLQISLPTLLQWAYARCQHWQRDWPPQPPSGNEPMTRAGATPLDPLTAQLQPIILRCWDDLAAHAHAPQQWQQSGYAMAQAIYTLEAQRSHWATLSLSNHSATRTMTITQAFLALLLQVLTGATPVSAL